MSIAKSAPESKGGDGDGQPQSEREQPRGANRRCRGQSTPGMRRNAETKMMTSSLPPRGLSWVTALLWWLTTRPQSQTATSLNTKQHRSRVYRGARWKNLSSLSILVCQPQDEMASFGSSGARFLLGCEFTQNNPEAHDGLFNPAWCYNPPCDMNKGDQGLLQGLRRYS